MTTKILRILLVPVLLFTVSVLSAQDAGDLQPKGVEVDYANPKKYIIGGIDIPGLKYLSKDQLIAVSGLHVGTEITVPSDELSFSLKRLWLQGAASSLSMYVDSLSAGKDTCFLRLDVEELPRVIRWDYRGVRNGEKDDLKDKLNLRRGSQLSQYVINTSVDLIKEYYKEKGFLNCSVNVIQARDSMVKNSVKVIFDVKKGSKVKIKKITYEGNDNVTKYKLDKAMKNTHDAKWYNFFKSKKFKEKDYDADKKALIDKFNEDGYRDARLVSDSIYVIDESHIGIHFKFDQGRRYYFRNITWTGNSEYDEEALNGVLRIDKGSIYDVITMEKRLFGGEEGDISISKLYRDNGYLFFNVTPVEVNIEGDSVDVEMRMVEGKPATFNNIIINGNTITSERVVRRGVFTRPGYLFRQTDFERSVREIASMGHFDPETAADPSRGYSLIPNSLTNTVDIAYNVEEKSNSQIELSGGWGNNMFVGSVGLSFNNFSTRNFLRKECWKPVPLGDAQTLSFRFQTNGKYYTSVSANFVEPWLTGKKPTSLNISAYYSRQTNSYISDYYSILNEDQYMEVFGASIGFGTRLKWPDSYFVLYNQLGWQTYNLQNWAYYFLYDTGRSHNFSWTITLSRNSTDQMLYPRSGSDFSLTCQLTPPWSLMRSDRNEIDWSKTSTEEHYKWIEYNKWVFKGTVYTKLIGDLVLMTRAYFGYLGYYNRKWGYSPFEGFMLGGDGMSGYNTYGSEVIGLRGYENYALTPYNAEQQAYAGHVYDKFTVELRYPVVMQPSSTIYALVFLEGGNCWADIHNFNPFQIKRSAGVGVRVFLPIVGMLGVDWGYGFDSLDNKSQFHFVIGQQF